MNDLALFETPEPYRADPVTTVREHTRRLRKPIEPKCRVCGVILPYTPPGRPPVWCESHRPEESPPTRTQINQWQSGMVRRGDFATSKDAAKLAALTAGTLRAKCLLALADATDGLTDFELGARVNRQQTSAGKRRGELVEAGYVENSHEKRPSPSKAFAAVWVITDAGRAKASELRGSA